jgi:hypothetical protein
MEALNALREATMGGQEIRREGDDLLINARRFSVKAETPVLAADGGHYPLGSLFVSVRFADAKNVERLAEYSSLGVPRVHFNDHKKVVAYLRGENTGEDVVDASFVPTAPVVAPAAEGASGSSSSSAVGGEIQLGAASALVMRSAAASGGRVSSHAERVAAQAALLEEVLKREVPISTRNSVLAAPGVDLTTLVFRQFTKPEDAAAAAGGVKRSRAGKKLSTRERLEQARREKEGGPAPAARPIPGASSASSAARGAAVIIVPNAASSLITLFNAPRFLQDAYFVHPTEARSAMTTAGADKPWKVTIQRQVGGKVLRYHILDSVSRLKHTDWDKVVAVFAHGPDWQFKGWRWGRPEGRPDISPVEIFDRVMGFHLHYDDEPVPTSISRWSVMPLGVSKSQRHLDPGVVAKFWDRVDRFVSVKKPFLLADAKPPSSSASASSATR